MKAEELLAKGVDRQIISDEQRQSLLALREAKAPSSSDILQNRVSLDEDQVSRLVGGGNDVFVTIGVLLLLVGGFIAFKALIGSDILVLYSICAIAIWLIAEFVTRQRRMKLSSTVLSIGFIICIFEITSEFITRKYDFSDGITAFEAFAILGDREQLYITIFVSAGAMVLAALVYFWRFKVPIMTVVVAWTLTLLIFIFAGLSFYDSGGVGRLAGAQFEDIMTTVSSALYFPLGCGLIIFVIAVFLDLRDRNRVTIWSDCAFWLHVTSAPLLVHPLFVLSTGQTLWGGTTIESSSNATYMLIALIIIFTYIALIIDRRSLLIPTLLYFSVLGIASAVANAALSTGIPSFALILLVLGALVIMFGAGWQRIRALIVRPTVPKWILSRVPPIKTAA